MQKLLDQLIALSPADAKRPEELVNLLTEPDMMGAVSLKTSELQNIVDKFKMILAVLSHMGTREEDVPGVRAAL